MRTLKASMVIGATLFGLGCGGAAVPTERLTAAEASMRAAQEVGANAVPQAELHLKLAEEQVQLARKLSADGDNERAGAVLLRAKADADLALALAKDAQAEKTLEAADAKLKSMNTPATTPAATTAVSSAQ
jgi:multidrug efflux pump subunit AcrA (membrane-fusion protein)